ncbi:hypothetical protein LIA77_02627 [Sarocladium implicatum]|nr:hypothetical protein LIA77_02627 [Sarocladium implicatum]
MQRTYKMTNFRGRRDSTGKRVKQMTKQAAAPRLQAPKIIKRSHLLTYREEEDEVSCWSLTSRFLPPGCTPNFGVPLSPHHLEHEASHLCITCRHLGPQHAHCNAHVPSAAPRRGDPQSNTISNNGRRDVTTTMKARSKKTKGD